MTSHDHASPGFNPVRFWLLMGGVIVLVVGLSVAYSRFLQTVLPKADLPIFATVKSDLEATERSGKAVRFSDLKGKVIVAAYLYTQCPHGCAAVAIQPERDSVAMLKGYAEAVGATEKSPWWFITGDRQKLWDFMTKEVGMVPAQPIPEDERITPEDEFQHDLRIALLDGQGRVRGYYAVFHPQPEIASLRAERLHDHVHQLLDHPHS